MVEKGIRGGIYHSLRQYVKAINKYMKDYHKNKKGSYLKYWDVNNIHEWALSKKLPVNGLKSFGEAFQFNDGFIEAIMKKLTKDILLMFNILKSYMSFITIYHF